VNVPASNWGTRSRGSAGPPRVSSTPTGGGLGAARPWGRSEPRSAGGWRTLTTVATLCAALAACATQPAGPSLPALPGSRLTPAQFAADDQQCRALALAQGGGRSPADAANEATAAGAAAGTALGAATGALLDGHSGAAAGAAIGLLYGASFGAAASPGAFAAAQQQYDNAYHGCMYTRGHKVPVPAHAAGRFRSAYGLAAPAAGAPAAAPAAAAAPMPPPPDLMPADRRAPPAPPSATAGDAAPVKPPSAPPGP
jgi:hypothetical protein